MGAIWGGHSPGSGGREQNLRENKGRQLKPISLPTCRRMPASKRVSTRPQSPTSSSQDGGDALAKVAPNGVNPPVGERISTRDWSVESLLELGKGKFEPVERISARKLSAMEIVEVVHEFEKTGRPLILEEWHLREDWNKNVLNADYLGKRFPNQGRLCLSVNQYLVEPTVDP
jgi:hypothetical protein